MADVFTNPANPVLGSRTFGSDVDTVNDMVAATVEGMQREDVSAVLKHFPGHGDTVQDSHEEAAEVRHDLQRLLDVELQPFSAGIDAGTDGVMIGHIAAPRVTGTTVPATLEPMLVTGLLRERMGFDGVIVTDSLTMAGLTRYFDDDEIAVRAVSAGVDILLRPAQPRRASEALIGAVERGVITEARIDQSVRRILRVKFRRGLLIAEPADGTRAARSGGMLWRPASRFVPTQIVLGVPEHRAVVEEIVQRAAER